MLPWKPNIATGYAFACEGKWQPSLNINRELSNQYNDETILDTFDGTLKPWICYFINSGLTCELGNLIVISIYGILL